MKVLLFVYICDIILRNEKNGGWRYIHILFQVKSENNIKSVHKLVKSLIPKPKGIDWPRLLNL